ncbi:ATP-binding protein [Streptomyces sp. NPDC051704]|uniref:ATP-binding protein n=1 Tax=Streptomyces sp. NPDC051704 TaxID=3365671 RepID=UPI003789C808
MDTPTSTDGTPGSHRRQVDGLPAVTTAAAARCHVSESLQRIGVNLDSVIAADAFMVVSELVTNATRHGGGITLFRTDITGDALHVSVGDASTRTPAAHRSDPGQPGGYGWPLIQRLAEHIDITLHPEGKTIRAVLRLS